MLRGNCYVCFKRRGQSIHELIGGSEFRHHTERDPLFWAAVCEGPTGCHGRVQSNFAEWPLARMIAHKLVAEGGEFDLLRFNQIVGGRHAVTMEQIDYWLNEMEVWQ